jgi:hypothetical protein
MQVFVFEVFNICPEKTKRHFCLLDLNSRLLTYRTPPTNFYFPHRREDLTRGSLNKKVTSSIGMSLLCHTGKKTMEKLWLDYEVFDCQYVKADAIYFLFGPDVNQFEMLFFCWVGKHANGPSDSHALGTV